MKTLSFRSDNRNLTISKESINNEMFIKISIEEDLGSNVYDNYKELRLTEIESKLLTNFVLEYMK